jgi:hypothetical protein
MQHIHPGIPSTVYSHELTSALMYAGPVMDMLEALSDLPAGGQARWEDGVLFCGVGVLGCKTHIITQTCMHCNTCTCISTRSCSPPLRHPVCPSDKEGTHGRHPHAQRCNQGKCTNKP